MVTQPRSLTAGEWLGAGPRPGRPLQAPSFTLSTFAVQADKVVAVGTLSAVLETTPEPCVDTSSIVTTVTLPVSIRQTSDETLQLDIGPMIVDLLGLHVNLGRMALDVTAQSGPGHLLGAVGGRRDDPARLVKLLNEILATL
jgi:hypothetical protein